MRNIRILEIVEILERVSERNLRDFEPAAANRREAIKEAIKCFKVI